MLIAIKIIDRNQKLNRNTYSLTGCLQPGTEQLAFRGELELNVKLPSENFKFTKLKCL